MKAKIKTSHILEGLIAISLFVVLSYFAVWQVWTPTINQIEGLHIVDFGLNEQGTIYFDISDYRANGAPLSRQNHYASIDTETLEINAHVVAGQVQQHEVHHNGYTSYYETSPLIIWGQGHQFAWAGIPIATGGVYVVRDENGRKVDTVSDSQGIDLHDLVISQEGSYIYLAAHIVPMYRDATLTCLPACEMLGQSIVEVSEDGHELYRYHLLDYYSRNDFLMDDMLILGNTNLYDLTHANSVRLSPDNRSLIVSVRHTNEVLVISRDSGDLIWRSNDYTFTNDTGFSHQHDAQILDNGNLLLFDNGNETGTTRAVEYQVDHEQESLTLVWEYVVSDHWQPNRGSVRRTPQGNTLINWVQRDTGDLEIISPDGEVLFSVTIPEPWASYRAAWQSQSN